MSEYKKDKPTTNMAAANMAALLKKKNEQPVKGFEDIEECLDGVDIEALIDEEESEQGDDAVDSFFDSAMQEIGKDSNDFCNEMSDDLSEECDEESDDLYSDMMSDVSDEFEEDDSDELFDDVTFDCSNSQDVYNHMENCVNNIIGIMNGMVSFERANDTFITRDSANKVCDHLSEAVERLRASLCKNVSDGFKW